jgi:thiol-disulfide isomerase/thioredoxin
LYPSEEGAREWSEALTRLGRDGDALEHLADAFAVPDAHTTDADRAADRVRLGELYSKLHESEKGLGDLLLAAYDRTAALVEARRTRVLALDPNAAVTDPIAFTLTGLDGSKLPLAKLKGSVVVMDFWATWCKPCQTQHPMYEEVKQRFRGRSDVVFLAVDADEDHSVVSPFLDEQKWSRTSVYFEDGLSRLLEVSSIPTTILFDKQARVSSRMNGFVPDRFVDQLTQRILQALLESVDVPDK